MSSTARLLADTPDIVAAIRFFFIILLLRTRLQRIYGVRTLYAFANDNSREDIVIVITVVTLSCVLFRNRREKTKDKNERYVYVMQCDNSISGQLARRAYI